MSNRFILIFLLSFFGGSLVFAQENHDHKNEMKPLEYVSNEGQWSNNILFESKVGHGSVFLESNCLTFSQLSTTDIATLDELVHKDGDEWKNLKMNGHAWKVFFQNALNEPTVSGNNKLVTYHNYFLGNDESRWKGNVPLFESVLYSELYPSIDLKTYSEKGEFKYDFIVHPGGNAKSIELRYEELEGISIEKGNLRLQTSVGVFTETAPFAYQIISGKKVQVTCNFKLKENVLRFEFPAGYDENVTLVIDPTLMGATLSGTVGGFNYGHAATYDNAGNIYSAARNFSTGYPTTLGAFQTTSGGGQDIAISKLSPNASTLIYATVLGGNLTDLPHSMFVNNANELFLLGSSGSSNFPVSSGAFSTILGGMTDIVLTHFTATGTGIVGSTYVGGSLADGINSVTSNYGDAYRGEIIVDAAGNCFVVSGSNSANFPTTAGAFQTIYGGNGDAVVFKMNASLTTMMWSTYVGGWGNEFGLGIRLDNAGDVYFCGATKQSFMVATGYQPNYAGLDDGFIIKLTNNGSLIAVSTYVGTSAKDNAFFIDLDAAGRVYVYGQTSGGSMTTTIGTYNSPLSRQYINRFDPTLATRDISSLIGSGNIGSFVPIAFMVDNCGFIYFSGHSAMSSSLLPLSANAIQTTGGIYIGVLEPDATGLFYATRYGGLSDHADGGTSRFDPSGVIYQSVCTINGFNSTLGAHSSTYPSGFDIGVFKIAFEALPVGASASFQANTMYCSPLTATFTNNSSGSNFIWDFGDGSPIDTTVNPVHVYTAPGTYDAMLVAIDSNSCLIFDTTYMSIEVPGAFEIDLGPDTVLCSGTIMLLPNFSGGSYLWQDGSTDSTYEVNGPGIYYVTVTEGPCVASDTIQVFYSTVHVDFGPDGLICTGDSVILDAGVPGATYIWSDGSSAQTLVADTPGLYSVLVNGSSCSDADTIILSAEPIFNLGPDTTLCSGVLNLVPTISGASSAVWQDGSVGTNYSVNSSGTYYVTVTTNACISIDTIEVMYSPVNVDLGIDHLLCAGDSITLDSGVSGTTYLWSDNSINQTLTVSTSGVYSVTVNNSYCADSDSVIVSVESINLGFSVVDTIGCMPVYTQFFDSITSSASISYYEWDFGDGTMNSNEIDPFHVFSIGTTSPIVSLLVITENGCSYDYSRIVHFELTPKPVASFSFSPQLPEVGSQIDFVETSAHALSWYWDFGDGVTSNAQNPNHVYFNGDTKEITLIVENNGCFDTVQMNIVFDTPLIYYVPNAFTPDEDEFNPVFLPIFTAGFDPSNYSLVIFNRWGELIFTSNDPEAPWDGTYKGVICSEDVYSWKIEFGENLTGNKHLLTGHVSLLK